MPLYSYRNTATGEVKDIFQSMTDEHIYFEDGIEWSRVWEPSQFNFSSQNKDPYSKSAFSKETEGKKMTIGDLWDKSAELSAKRADKEGSDPVREKFYSDYSKTRGGKEHPEKTKEKSKQLLKDVGLNISG